MTPDDLDKDTLNMVLYHTKLLQLGIYNVIGYKHGYTATFAILSGQSYMVITSNGKRFDSSRFQASLGESNYWKCMSNVTHIGYEASHVSW